MRPGASWIVPSCAPGCPERSRTMTIITSNIENDSSDGYDLKTQSTTILVVNPDVTILSGEIGVLAGANEGGGTLDFDADDQIFNYGQIISFAGQGDDYAGVYIANSTSLNNESSGSIEGYYGV